MSAPVEDMLLSEDDLNSLYRYAMTLCHQRDNAYDLLQSALEKYLIEQKCQRGAVENPMAFVRTLIRNRFIDQYRYDRRWDTQVYEDFSTYDISPVRLEQVSIDAQTLDNVWSELCPLDRDILYHWAVLGYSTDETCEQLEMPRGTLLSRIHRLRKKLQHHRDEPAAPEKMP
jgi:RNA polymerase sigma factor (sigma-70 family)